MIKRLKLSTESIQKNETGKSLLTFVKILAESLKIVHNPGRRSFVRHNYWSWLFAQRQRDIQSLVICNLQIKQGYDHTYGERNIQTLKVLNPQANQVHNFRHFNNDTSFCIMLLLHSLITGAG